jgi:Ca2+-binding RTX toxin-like protein
VHASGNRGDDRLTTNRTEAAVTLFGGRGKDRITGLSNRGKALLDAGRGNDTLFVSREDDADRRDNGGISTVRAGRGDDTLYVMSDGDRDLIDCGPGPDRFRFTQIGVRFPPRENRYRRCPRTRDG